MYTKSIKGHPPPIFVPQDYEDAVSGLLTVQFVLLDAEMSNGDVADSKAATNARTRSTEAGRNMRQELSLSVSPPSPQLSSERSNWASAKSEQFLYVFRTTRDGGFSGVQKTFHLNAKTGVSSFRGHFLKILKIFCLLRIY